MSEYRRNDSNQRGEDDYRPRRVRVNEENFRYDSYDGGFGESFDDGFGEDDGMNDFGLINTAGFERARAAHQRDMEDYSARSHQKRAQPVGRQSNPAGMRSRDGAFASLECDRVDTRPAPKVKSAPPQKKKRKKKKHRHLKRWLRRVALLVVVLVLLYYVLAHIALGGINVVSEEAEYSDTPPQAVEQVRARNPVGVTNLLLLGIDSDGSAGSRSDTIIIASINHFKGTLRLCSVLRDCYVEIPGRDATRINHAYGYGGIALARQTVENNFRIKFDGVIAVDMNSLIHIVDALGGVEIELSEAEAEQINTYAGGSVGAGVQTLNGAQAVYYSRIRKIDSDFARTGRQRALISAILAKCKGRGAFGLLAESGEIMPYITTTMSKPELSTLALRSLSVLSGEFEQMTIPAEGTYTFKSVRDMSVLDLDLAENVRLLHEFLF